jgi:quinolinate synthase
VDSFPSLVIRRDGFIPKGSYAEAQATYLEPDLPTVQELDGLLRAKQIGVVAHFYMDAELQGVLSALTWPHVQISDSLAMADRAVRMVEAGAKAVVVLGVDFMSENVRAVLDHAGHSDVPVYRVSEDAIGCSLAESAEADAYSEWLGGAQSQGNSLHVIYINTSLAVKARSHHQVPTLTCTSSNVVQSVLQAAAQIPDVHVWYGPDTYMGDNLVTMLDRFSTMTDAEIAAIHPAHNRGTITSLRQRFHTFRKGVCIVHHMFGDDVARRVREEYSDAYWTAHLEVPGEMFELAAWAQSEGRGVVGSTSNILGFISERVGQRLQEPGPARISFVLGTESGMITSIVKQVRELLKHSGRDDIEVEIVFPVASEAVAESDILGVVPGVKGGEGCTAAGGCATCPFMKMNDLEALFGVVETIGTDRQQDLQSYAPRKYTEQVGGRSAAEVGTEPILHMRHFQRTGKLPDALVRDVQGR